MLLTVLDAPPAPAKETPQSQPQKPPLLTYGITGSDSTDLHVPTTSSLMSHWEVQKLLLDIAAAPREKSFLEAALKETGVPIEDLEATGLVRREGDRYAIHFTLLTDADMRKVREVAETYARSLVAAYLAHREEIEAILKQHPQGTQSKALAYILLGCFSLDWDGLGLLSEKGYRAPAREEPGGLRYTPWAEQRGELTLQGIYWGSHNEYLRDVAFTSFGDHFSLPRYALPDLLWRMQGALRQVNAPEPLKLKLLAAARGPLEEMASEIGRMMLALRDADKTPGELAKAAGLEGDETRRLLDLLVALDYVREQSDRYRATVPVLAQQDSAMVEKLIQLSRRVMDSWLAVNYQKIKADLAGTTPLRFGVPYEEAFTQIWHYIFGTANRQLVHAGLFANPYAEGRKYKGFIPAVWHPSLTQLIKP